MAVSVVAADTFSWAAGFGGTQTAQFDPTGANLLLAFICWPESALAPQDVTFDGASMTEVPALSYSIAGNNGEHRVYRLDDPAQAESTFDLGFGGTDYINPSYATLVAVSGAGAGAPHQTAQAYQWGDPPAATLTGTAAGAIIIAAAAALQGTGTAFTGISLGSSTTLEARANGIAQGFHGGSAGGTVAVDAATDNSSGHAVVNVVEIRDSASISIDGFATVQAFGAPAYPLSVSVDGVASAPLFGDPAWPQVAELDGFANAQAFGDPGWPQVIDLDGIASALAFGAIGIASTISLTGLQTVQSFGGVSSYVVEPQPVPVPQRRLVTVTLPRTPMLTSRGYPSQEWTKFFQGVASRLGLGSTDKSIGGLEVGDLVQSARSQKDDRWLVCSGGLVSRTDYAELFDAIGTTYGNGDGATTFNLPLISATWIRAKP